MSIKILFLFLFMVNTLFANNKKETLLFYCGTTMSRAMSEMAKVIEQKENCKIDIIKGGSQGLYDSIKTSKIGDLYLPGSASYIKKNKKDGFFVKSVDIGFNQIVMFVKKGNPKHIHNLDDLLNKNLTIIIGNPELSSVGKNTKKMALLKGGKEFYYKLFDKSLQIVADSRAMNKFLNDKTVDVVINWRASILKDKFKNIDIIEINDKYAKKHKLLLTLLKFSKHKKIANSFIKFATSKEGQKIMERYGFK